MNTLSEQPNTSFKLAIVIAVIHSFFDTLLDDGMRLNLTTSLSSLQKKKNYLQFFGVQSTRMVENLMVPAGQ